MGACFSKCKPKKPHFIEDFSHHVQDKLVISQQATRTPIPQYSNKISPSPPSLVNSSSNSASSYSFTCPSNSTSSSTSSLSSASSASTDMISKDRSFSNEFLWSCFKENPRIIRINSLKENAAPMTTTKKESSQKRVIIASTPQKRLRSSSPNSQSLTRQKSFRKESDHRPVHSADYVPSTTSLRSPFPSRRFGGDQLGLALANTLADASSRRFGAKGNAVHSVHAADYVPSRTLRSPSPIRRFGGDQRGLALANTLADGSSRRFGAEGNTVHSVSTSLRKGNLGPISPNNSSRLVGSGLSDWKICTNQIVSKIEENPIKEVPSDHDMDSSFMEDIDNPLISLDCFIFL